MSLIDFPRARFVPAMLLLTAQALAADVQPLLDAIRNDDLAAAKTLAAGNANERGNRGVTPLMYAAAHGSSAMVKLLLDAGADVNAKNAFDATALIWAVNQPEKVRMLLDKGADVNAVTRMGRTALIVAASQPDNEPVVRQLLAKGADPKAVDKAGFSPLMAAALNADTALVRLFLELGNSPAQRNMFGFTPLIFVTSLDNLEAAKLLLAKGADVNARSNESLEKVKNGTIALGKLTPLLAAATFGSPALIRTLLDAGADVNARDVRGMTPLMLAVSSNYQSPEVVKLLLAKGADASVKSSAGETAYDWAAKFGHPGVLKLFPKSTAAPSAGMPVSVRAFETAMVRNAAQKSLSLLQTTSSSFFTNGGCVACHHHNTTGILSGLARARGLKFDDTHSAASQKATKGQWTAFSEGLLQRLDAPGGDAMVFYALLGMAGDQYAPDFVTDAMVHNLAAMQRNNGSWRGGLLARAPSEDGDIPRTAFALRALQLYAAPGRKAEMDDRIRRAAAWLEAQKPLVTEHSVSQLRAMKWTKGDSARIQRLAKDLIKQQRADGGWAQNRNLGSDAYATGQVLVALEESGIKTTDPAYRRGVAYLMSTQQSDGSWLVKSRAPKFQPYFESGFPYGHDQWISNMGTAWAAAALTLSLDPQPATAAR